jgi:hypothetical protein
MPHRLAQSLTPSRLDPQCDACLLPAVENATTVLCCAVQAHVSSQFLEDHLFVLQPVASGQQRLSARVVHLALQYLTHALELKDSYKLMKPHVEGLLVQVSTLAQLLFAHTART